MNWAESGSTNAARVLRSLHRDYRPYAEAALKQGFTCRMGRNQHPQFKPPDVTQSIIIASLTPRNGPSGAQKFRADLVRAGLRLEPETLPTAEELVEELVEESTLARTEGNDVVALLDSIERRLYGLLEDIEKYRREHAL